jgi:hypothetical protein
MQFKLTRQLMIKVILWTALWVFLGFLSAPLMAEAAGGSRISRSISFSSQTGIDKNLRDEQLKQAEADKMAPLIETGFRAESMAMALRIESTSYYAAGIISIYNASTDLISDFDNDSFYHRFSVMIDVDTMDDMAYVYARLYLSYEGGPWNHYATSNTYQIKGNSELDAFTIETELADGFTPGYYDVRIELYDADLDEWLLSYGPYDDASLRALALEDSFNDDLYRVGSYLPVTEVIVAGHDHGHGSMSWWLSVFIVLAFSMRNFVTDKEFTLC